MKSILITGGAGFIGSRLCEKLFERGYNITILDNLSSQIHGDGISSLSKRIKDRCTFIKGDVRNKKDWAKAILGQEIIVHLAAETGTGQSMYEIEKLHSGTKHCCKRESVVYAYYTLSRLSKQILLFHLY